MADETSSAQGLPEQGEEQTASDLGDAGKAAIDAERKARRAAERRASEIERQLKEIQDANNPEADRVRDQIATLTAERDSALSDLAAFRAAVKHGLSEEDLDFLVGTPEEIEEKAERLARRLSTQAQPRKPKPDPGQGAAVSLNDGDGLQNALFSKLGL